MSSAEVVFRKSSKSVIGDCVEVGAGDDGAVYVRDSKDPGGPVLTFTSKEWNAFQLGVQNGEFDV